MEDILTFYSAKNKLAQKYGYKDFNHMVNRIMTQTELLERIDEAAELYAEHKSKKAYEKGCNKTNNTL